MTCNPAKFKSPLLWEPDAKWQRDQSAEVQFTAADFSSIDSQETITTNLFKAFAFYSSKLQSWYQALTPIAVYILIKSFQLGWLFLASF